VLGYQDLQLLEFINSPLGCQVLAFLYNQGFITQVLVYQEGFQVLGCQA
jgi:hypothetical protein